MFIHKKVGYIIHLIFSQNILQEQIKVGSNHNFFLILWASQTKFEFPKMAEVSAVDVSKSGQIKAKLLVALLLFFLFFVILVKFSHKMHNFIPTTSSIRTRIQCSCNTLADALQKPQIWGCLNALLLDQKKKNTIYPSSPSHAHYRKQNRFCSCTLLFLLYSFSPSIFLSLFCSVFTSHLPSCYLQPASQPIFSRSS